MYRDNTPPTIFLLRLYKTLKEKSTR